MQMSLTANITSRSRQIKGESNTAKQKNLGLRHPRKQEQNRTKKADCERNTEQTDQCQTKTVGQGESLHDFTHAIC
jgi:hypothetical protein